MDTLDKKVLSYTGFVELWCRESDGTYRSDPSSLDVQKAAEKLGLPRPRSSSFSGRPSRPEYRRYMTDWDTLRRSRFELFRDWHHYNTCRWCGSEIDHLNDNDVSGRFTYIERRSCRGCGWWDTDACLPVNQEGRWYEAFSIHRRAILKEFSISSVEVPVADLARHIARHPQSVFKVEPYKMEELVAGIFARTMSCRVEWLGGPGDGGVDLLLVSGDDTYAMQVKRMSSVEHPIRVSLVREFVGAMVIEGLTKGVFVTTSSLTKHAERAAIRATHRISVDRVDLVDGSRLVKLCGLAEWPNLSRASAERYEEPLMSHHLRPGDVQFHNMAFRQSFTSARAP